MSRFFLMTRLLAHRLERVSLACICGLGGKPRRLFRAWFESAARDEYDEILPRDHRLDGSLVMAIGVRAVCPLPCRFPSERHVGKSRIAHFILPSRKACRCLEGIAAADFRQPPIYPVRTPPTPVGGVVRDSRWWCNAPIGRSRSARSNGVYAIAARRCRLRETAGSRRGAR